MVWGDQHRTPSAGECCAACHAHRAAAARGGLDKGPNSTTCNTWVWCGDRERCGGHYQECWLKHQATLPPADAPRPNNGPAMWSSGIVYDGDTMAQAYDKYSKLTMHTPIGDLVINLLPDLAPAVVRELRRQVLVMMVEGGGCGGCKFYRVEDFGIQGVILAPGAYVGTPTVTTKAPMAKIPPGYVCRAGFAGSVHFFINFFETDWGEALCWGSVGEQTMALAKDMSKRPIRQKASPSELSMLAEELHFNMTLSV